MSEEPKDDRLTNYGLLLKRELEAMFDLDKASVDAFALVKDSEKFKEWLRIGVGFATIEFVKVGRTDFYYQTLAVMSNMLDQHRQITQEYTKN